MLQAGDQGIVIRISAVARHFSPNNTNWLRGSSDSSSVATGDFPTGQAAGAWSCQFTSISAEAMNT